MEAFVSKRDQVKNLLTDIQNIISNANFDTGIHILRWTIEKISLATAEKNRQSSHKTDKSRNLPRSVRRGEIYGANLGNNIGSEQNGRSRPVLIIQSDHTSRNSPTIIVAPLSDAYYKDGSKKNLLNTHVAIMGHNLTKESNVKLEHIRCISKNRLNSLICSVEESKDVMKAVDSKLSYLFNSK